MTDPETWPVEIVRETPSPDLGEMVLPDETRAALARLEDAVRDAWPELASDPDAAPFEIIELARALAATARTA